MMVLCNATVVVGYDRRRSGLPSAPVVTEYDNNSIEQSTVISLNMNIDYQSHHLLSSCLSSTLAELILGKILLPCGR